MRIIAIFFTLIWTFSSWAGGALTTQQKLSDFYQLVTMIDNSYGPKNYKAAHAIASLPELTTIYERKILGTVTDEEFHATMFQFVAEFKDGHFGIRAPESYSQVSPYNTDLVEGKVIVTGVDESKLGEKQKQLQVGDEILAVNGRAIGEVLNDLSRYVASGYQLTIRRIAAWMILSRSSARSPVFPENSVEVKIRKWSNKNIETQKIELTEGGEKLPETEDTIWPMGTVSVDEWLKLQNLSNLEMLAGLPQAYIDRSFMCSGKSRIEKPENSTVIMEEPFVAYYYPTEKGNVGYLRIPHYSPSKQPGEEGVEDISLLRFEQYEYAVSELENNTVALVIDQDHNCGGSVTWLEKFLGLFMNEPYAPMKFRFRASREEYLEFKDHLSSSPFLKNTLSYKGWEQTVELVKTHWLAGDYLTDFGSFYHLPEYQPNPIRYTKPIVVLIDEMSGSGGDAFPSMIGGYGRAKLLGTRTSGLGGHVSSMPNLNYSRMTLRMTKSLFFRPDGVPVENNGAVPDIEYQIKVEDVVDGYKLYRSFYTEKVLELVDQASVNLDRRKN